MSALSGRRPVATVLAVCVFGLLVASGASSAKSHGARAVVSSARGARAVSGEPWTDASQPALARANELLAALDTDQKIQLALGNFAALSSFGVPTVNADDGPDGLRNPGTTAMPSGQALAATFDRALAFAYGSVVGSEARGEGLTSGSAQRWTSTAPRWPAGSQRPRGRILSWLATRQRRSWPAPRVRT